MLNPITYTERVVGDFLRYPLTTYPFADRGLHEHPTDLFGRSIPYSKPQRR